MGVHWRSCEPLAIRAKNSLRRMDFSSARKDLPKELHKRDSEVALKAAELALMIWQSRNQMNR